MRRLLVAAALGTAVLVAAGCSTDKAGEPAPASQSAAAGIAGSPTVAASGASGAKPGGAGTAQNAGDAALAGNTAAVCNQAAKTGAQFGAMFAQDLKLLIDAESSKDASLVAKSEQKTARDMQNYSFALADLSKLVADPTVKQALADMSKQVVGLQGDVRKLDDTAAGKLQATLDQACGR